MKRPPNNSWTFLGVGKTLTGPSVASLMAIFCMALRDSQMMEAGEADKAGTSTLLRLYRLSFDKHYRSEDISVINGTRSRLSGTRLFFEKIHRIV